jgi:hypothetical protein
MFENERRDMITVSTTTDAVVTAAARAARFTALAAGPSLWRLADALGVVVGHIQLVGSGDAARFRAQRYHPSSRAFRVLGDFWSCAQAVEALRFSR